MESKIVKFFKAIIPSKKRVDDSKDLEIKKRETQKKAYINNFILKAKQSNKTEPFLDMFSDETIDFAKKEACLLADHKKLVGAYCGSIIENADTVTHQFISNHIAYPDWNWNVTISKVDPNDSITIIESKLLPKQNAFLAPKWIEYKDRLRVFDITETDEFAYESDDLRIENTFDNSNDNSVHDADSADNSDNADSADNSDQNIKDMINLLKNEDVKTVSKLAFERNRVLNAYGKQDLSYRWYEGSHGPKTASSRISQASCNSCAFYISLQGDMGQMFGVCANAWSRDDGSVVSLDHGCGMHSETDVKKSRANRWVQSELVVDEHEKFDLAQDVDVQDLSSKSDN